jgi:PAS domain S-box-containing protein
MEGVTQGHEETEEASNAAEEPCSPRSPCPVVGVGASAGGLDAFQALFSCMPADSGMAFVLVQHLDPRHETLMPELLARHTSMPVQLVTEDTTVRTDHIYVTPPDTTVTIDDCVLRVSRPERARGRRTPIDSFFRSLAEDQGDDAVAIVLSGTGADGALGLRTVREHGGLTLVQTPASARYDSMPRSAILTGMVDHVLPVEEIPGRLLDHLRHLTASRGGAAVEGLRQEVEEHLPQICSLLRRQSGHDFSRYKQSTLIRRVRRRMADLRADSAAVYLELLRGDSQEADRLFRDLLIGVTHFFRDAEAFEALEHKVIPHLFERKGFDEQVRVWVPGCSTGEEAYSIAILLRERAAALEEPPHVQIFATDIDAQALETARQAWYPESIAGQVSAERLERFFVRHGNLYQVSKEIREMCLFSAHNIIADPPFSRLDLVSCRNLLIYLEADLQKKLIPLYHYALRSGGFLFLGPSEGVAAWPDLFRAVDKRLRIFQAKDVILRPPVIFPLTERSRSSANSARPPVEGISRPPQIRSQNPAFGGESGVVEEDGEEDGGSEIPAGAAGIIRGLKSELRSTRGHLQATLEELESSNEELLSINEELQSANEELQTSKEELQSVNEELEAINAELKKKVEVLKVAQRQQARLAAIVESSHDAIIGKTLDGTVTSWNAGAERLYGYTAQEAVGRPISFLAPPDRLGELAPIFERLRRGEVVLPFETVRVRKDGRRLDILLTISPVLDSAGQIVEASAIAHDITEQKRAEEALQAEARRKDEFLAMLGHELRNPLAPIRNSLHILALQGKTEAQSLRARETIDRQVTHLTRLVDDLLDISRISRGKISLRKERLDLAAAVRSTVDDYRLSISAAELDLGLELPDGSLWVSADPTRLSQVVGNVLHNAVKFTDRGGRISVVLREERREEAGQALVSVLDTGMGMDRETLERLFEPFNQADSGIDRSRGGLGLGLALVRRLVEMHGGTVQAHSKGVNMGTRIDIRLPLAEQREASTAAAGSAPVGPRRCLVIEDNLDAAESMGLLLELSGHAVEIAHDGQRGLEAARRFHPDVVLCDIGLPGGLDGYEVARQMRQDPALQGVRLIALTGYGQEDDQRRAREAGFDIHLTKPADPEKLERLLADLP